MKGFSALFFMRFVAFMVKFSSPTKERILAIRASLQSVKCWHCLTLPVIYSIIKLYIYTDRCNNSKLLNEIV